MPFAWDLPAGLSCKEQKAVKGEGMINLIYCVSCLMLQNVVAAAAANDDSDENTESSDEDEVRGGASSFAFLIVTRLVKRSDPSHKSPLCSTFTHVAVTEYFYTSGCFCFYFGMILLWDCTPPLHSTNFKFKFKFKQLELQMNCMEQHAHAT